MLFVVAVSEKCLFFLAIITRSLMATLGLRKLLLTGSQRIPGFRA